MPAGDLATAPNLVDRATWATGLTVLAQGLGPGSEHRDLSGQDLVEFSNHAGVERAEFGVDRRGLVEAHRVHNFLEVIGMHTKQGDEQHTQRFAGHSKPTAETHVKNLILRNTSILARKRGGSP